MEAPIYMAKHNKNGLIKVYDFDHEDFQIVTTGDVKYPSIFKTKAGRSVNDAVDQTCISNDIKLIDVIKGSHQ